MTLNGERHIFANSGSYRFLMAAGGTGGHVYPAVAIADALREQSQGSEFLFVGTRDRMEWKAVPKAGYAIEPIWISGFHRRFTLKNLLFPLKVVVSLLQSMRIVHRFRPDAVVACGGFAAGPIGWVASKFGIPLFLQEQNSFPGVTTRLLAKKARAIYLTMPLMASLPGVAADRTEVLGNPVRSTFLKEMSGSSDKAAAEWVRSIGLDPEKPIVLILGGSGGSEEINKAVWENLDRIMGGHDGKQSTSGQNHQVKAGEGEDKSVTPDLQLIWQAGTAFSDRYQTLLESESSHFTKKATIRIMGFIDEMPSALRAADVVVTRSGAGAISEIMLFQKASILVPSAHVAGDHQRKNAEWMNEQGAAVVLESHELHSGLTKTIHELIANPISRKELATNAGKLAKPEAANEIATRILRSLSKASNSDVTDQT